MNIPKFDADRYAVRTVVYDAGAFDVRWSVMKCDFLMEIDIQGIGFRVIFEPRHRHSSSTSTPAQCTTEKDDAGTLTEGIHAMPSYPSAILLCHRTTKINRTGDCSRNTCPCNVLCRYSHQCVQTS